MSALAAPILPGEVLAGKYRVEEILGRGGMGVVVAALHIDLDKLVAIKFLLGDALPVAVERFQREARAAAMVKSEHACRVFDVGRLETGMPYLVMEHLTGVDLGEKLDSEGPLPAAQVAGWVIEICDALAEAHALGIVHRDLKPSNIFLHTRPDGSICAKILDFGISKLPQMGAMTRSATILGSPLYMSPEQITSSRDVDARADIWSLGVVLYELLTGELPFRADSMVALAFDVREKDPPSVSSRRSDMPDGLSRVVARCLAKRPDARYASVVELAEALAAFAPATPISAKIARRGAGRGGARAAVLELARTVANADDGRVTRPLTAPPTQPATRPATHAGTQPMAEPEREPATQAGAQPEHEPVAAPAPAATPAPAPARATSSSGRPRAARATVLAVSAFACVAALATLLFVLRPTERPQGIVPSDDASIAASTALAGPGPTASTGRVSGVGSMRLEPLSPPAPSAAPAPSATGKHPRHAHRSIADASSAAAATSSDAHPAPASEGPAPSAPASAADPATAVVPTPPASAPPARRKKLELDRTL